MKKGRVETVTRPQPTIYGNCDSWNFIVGTKRGAPTPIDRNLCALWRGNRQLIHTL